MRPVEYLYAQRDLTVGSDFVSSSISSKSWRNVVDEGSSDSPDDIGVAGRSLRHLAFPQPALLKDITNADHAWRYSGFGLCGRLRSLGQRVDDRNRTRSSLTRKRRASGPPPP